VYVRRERFLRTWIDLITSTAYNTSYDHHAMWVNNNINNNVNITKATQAAATTATTAATAATSFVISSRARRLGGARARSWCAVYVQHLRRAKTPWCENDYGDGGGVGFARLSMELSSGRRRQPSTPRRRHDLSPCALRPISRLIFLRSSLSLSRPSSLVPHSLLPRKYYYYYYIYGVFFFFYFFSFISALRSFVVVVVVLSIRRRRRIGR